MSLWRLPPINAKSLLEVVCSATRSQLALTGVPLGTQIWHEGLERAALVARYAQKLKDEGWRPDLILAHSGWGETIGLQEVWPDVPQILWPELWVRPEHGGYGVDPMKPSPGLDSRLEQLGRNALTRTAMSAARGWVLPYLSPGGKLAVRVLRSETSCDS